MKKVIIIIISALILIQFITIDKTNPNVDISKDFITLTKPPSEIEKLLKSSCYDCHSHNTNYPWYSNIAPVSWIIKNHINDGRNHLNFSVWPDYKEAKKEHKLEECIEMVESSEMPMKGYVLLHNEAELTDEERKQLVYWFKSVKDSL